MKRYIFALSVSAMAMILTGCPGDDPSDPSIPAIGTQIDRAGRPGVSTALIAAFDASGTAKDTKKDDWNAGVNGDTAFVPEIMANLGILDSLNVDVGGTNVAICGDQILSDLATPRYSALAGVLSDDRVWLNTADTQSCITEVQAFLAVEAAATGLNPAAGSLCGGRLPTQDVIGTLYTVLASDGASPLDDTILIDGDGAADDDAFPYLTAAN